MENEETTRKRFDTFARTVSRDVGRISNLIQVGRTNEAQRIAAYLVEESCLHIRRLNGVPDNYDDSAEGAANDYSLTDLNTEYDSDGQ